MEPNIHPPMGLWVEEPAQAGGRGVVQGLAQAVEWEEPVRLPRRDAQQGGRDFRSRHGDASGCWGGGRLSAHGWY